LERTGFRAVTPLFGYFVARARDSTPGPRMGVTDNFYHGYKDFAPTEHVTNKADTLCDLCALLFNSKPWPCSGLHFPTSGVPLSF
jgi:hypothetical protein